MVIFFKTKSLFSVLILFFLFYAPLLGQGENIPEKLIQAKEWRKKSQYIDAEKILSKLLNLDIANNELKADILFEYGFVQILQKKYPTTETYFNNAAQIYLEINNIVKWAGCQLKLAFILLETNPKSQHQIIEMLNACLKYENNITKENPELLEDIYNNLAVSYYYLDDLTKMKHCYDKIYNLSQQYPLKNVTTIINLADYFATNHEILKSLNLVNQAEQLLKAMKFEDEASVSYIISLAYIYLLADKHEAGITFMQKFIHLIDNPKINNKSKNEYFKQLGDFYYTMDLYTDAKIYYKKSETYIFTKTEREKYNQSLKLLMCNAQISKNYKDIDLLKKQYQESKNIISPYMRAYTELQIGKIQYNVNNFLEAKIYLSAAKSFYNMDKDHKRLRSVLNLESSIDQILKNVNSKKITLNTYKSNFDSLVTLERDAIEALTLKNANDQKALEMQAKELELSTEREKSLNSRIQLQNVMIISLLGAILLFVALYQYKKRLQKQKAMAKVREEELQSYNYFVSHDLLQPINNVKNLVHQLDSIPINQKDKINTQLHSAQNIVERLLHLFQIEKTDLYLTPFNVNEWINKIISEYQFTYPEVSWQCFIDQTSNYKLRADVFLLTQCLKNILDNAIKYGTSNESPTITIITALSKNHFILKIADNGSGITNGNEATLFEPFKQLSPNKKGNGFGVGLSIVKKIIEKHEGLISAQNVSSGGLELKIELPFN